MKNDKITMTFLMVENALSLTKEKVCCHLDEDIFFSSRTEIN